MSDPAEGARGVPVGPTMPLSQTDPGQEVVLARVSGGRGLLHRLAEMGLTPGAAMRVISRGRPGPIIVEVRGTRLVLGRGMVHRIEVRKA